MISKASATLADLCRPGPPKIALSKLAKKCGVARQTVHAWVTGQYNPKLKMMLRLEKELGIPVPDWTKEP